MTTKEINKKCNVRLPEKIEGVVKCPNDFCITNKERGAKTSFNVLELDKILLQCGYCDNLIEQTEVEEYIKA